MSEPAPSELVRGPVALPEGRASSAATTRRAIRRKWLAAWLAVVLFLGAIFGLWYAFIRGPTDDLARMQGEWSILAAGRGEVGLVRIEGDRWAYIASGQEWSAHRIALNPDTIPKEIDLTSLDSDGNPRRFTAGPGKGTEVQQLGIYAFGANGLTIALAPVQEGRRPKTIDDPDGPPPLVLTKVMK